MNGELKACPKCHGTLEFLVDPYRPFDSASYRKCPDCHPAMKRPTPAPGALPELPEAAVINPGRDDAQMFLAPTYGFTADQMHAYARAYAEQCRAGVEVTNGAVQRAVDSFWSEMPEDERDDEWREWAKVKMRAALQSAFADDEGVE